MFSPDDYEGVRKPLGEAHTLPSHCYTSREFFEREGAQIFSSSWHFAGRVDEIPNAGDFLVLDTLAGSALICRDSKGQVNAFINACRHRGTRLKGGAGHCRQFVCPYHSWTYELDGGLRSAPGMDSVTDFSQTDYSLFPVRLEQWGGFLFVNFDAKAPALYEWLGDLPQRMQSHCLNDLRLVKRMEFEINANWKFLIENALEAYHTGTVHGETLGAQASESVQTDGEWDALLVLNDKSKSIATLPDEPQAFPFIEGLTNEAKKGTWFTVIYPCTQIVFAQDCAWWLNFKPLSVDRTRLTLGACFPQSTFTLSDFDSLVEPYFQRWAIATLEDNAIAEAQQKGHQSGYTMKGRYSLSEHCVHALNNWVLDRVLEATC